MYVGIYWKQIVFIVEVFEKIYGLSLSDVFSSELNKYSLALRHGCFTGAITCVSDWA